LVAPPADVLALFGPTAAGKSALAHAVAVALGGEIIVADPFQRYRGLEIAADAPSVRVRAEVPYHFVGDLDLTESSTAGQFAICAHEVIDAVRSRGRVPVVAGGTALYLRAAITELGFPPVVAPEIRAWAEELVARDLQGAATELALRDAAAAARVDTANPRRLVRALELAATPTQSNAPTERLWDDSMRVTTCLVVVTRPRELLDRLIATRVRRELDDGLVAELEQALATPRVSREALQIIGAREVDAMRRGEIDPVTLQSRLEARTRRLARRQMGWIRRWPHAQVLDLGDAPPVDALASLIALWHGSAGAGQ
jgi:tRNA dimethylallyltransferase